MDHDVMWMDVQKIKARLAELEAQVAALKESVFGPPEESNTPAEQPAETK